MTGIKVSRLAVLVFFFISSFTAFIPTQAVAQEVPREHETAEAEPTPQEEGEDIEAIHHGEEPAGWSVIPFVLLLVMIATGPLFYAHFWHKYYPLVAAGLGAIVVAYYIFALHNIHQPLHSLAEYVSFIALIGSLFVASGGILIKVNMAGKPMVNVVLLILGAFIANIIGTTGASMLLIRPFIRLNEGRVKPYHIVFFIFMVSNVGGCLTPIGDPPLFLGFLKGVPFEWTILNIWPFWLFGIALLALIFYFIDTKNYRQAPETGVQHSGGIQVQGLQSLIWLAVVIGAVFIDPNVVEWVPAWHVHGSDFSFVRELIMLGAAVMAYVTANKECLRGNEFNFEPIKEVGYLFIGIFATMMPALELIGDFANSDTGRELVNVHSLYWATGMLSGVLDNAPTYLNFLAAGMGNVGMDINAKAEVLLYSVEMVEQLLAISVGAVFFGAFTYIGNAPNFMVKSIAEQVGVEMPSFVGYIIRYSLPFLLPVLLLVWLVFFLFLY